MDSPWVRFPALRGELLFAVQNPRALGHKAMLARDPLLDFLIGDAWLDGLLLAGIARQVVMASIVIAGDHFAVRCAPPVLLLLLLTIRGRTVILPLDRQEEALMSEPSDLVQGTLDMLILKTLALEPMHGYGVALRIEQISNGVFHVNAGSLFSAFSRLERTGRVKSEWRATENNRRAKYYSLSERGRKALKDETKQWGRQIAAVARILEA